MSLQWELRQYTEPLIINGFQRQPRFRIMKYAVGIGESALSWMAAWGPSSEGEADLSRAELRINHFQ